MCESLTRPRGFSRRTLPFKSRKKTADAIVVHQRPQVKDLEIWRGYDPGTINPLSIIIINFIGAHSTMQCTRPGSGFRAIGIFDIKLLLKQSSAVLRKINYMLRMSRLFLLPTHPVDSATQQTSYGWLSVMSCVRTLIVEVAIWRCGERNFGSIKNWPCIAAKAKAMVARAVSEESDRRLILPERRIYWQVYRICNELGIDRFLWSIAIYSLEKLLLVQRSLMLSATYGFRLVI